MTEANDKVIRGAACVCPCVRRGVRCGKRFEADVPESEVAIRTDRGEIVRPCLGCALQEYHDHKTTEKGSTKA